MSNRYFQYIIHVCDSCIGYRAEEVQCAQLYVLKTRLYWQRGQIRLGSSSLQLNPPASCTLRGKPVKNSLLGETPLLNFAFTAPPAARRRQRCCFRQSPSLKLGMLHTDIVVWAPWWAPRALSWLCAPSAGLRCGLIPRVQRRTPFRHCFDLH